MPTLAACGDVQMAVDEALLDDALFVTARRYVWTPPALSLGKFQRLPEDLRREDLPFDVVRRPSGGRAVLHGEGFEWSFAVVFPPGTLPGRRIDDAYEVVSAALAEALSAAGVRLDETASPRTGARSSASPAACATTCSPPPARWRPWRRCAGARRRSCTAASSSVARPTISSPPSSGCSASPGRATGSPPPTPRADRAADAGPDAEAVWAGFVQQPRRGARLRRAGSRAPSRRAARR